MVLSIVLYAILIVIVLVSTRLVSKLSYVFFLIVCITILSLILGILLAPRLFHYLCFN